MAIAALTPNTFLPHFARSAAEWFLHSGIQEEHGGVARYYLQAQGRNARVSTEITGYAVKAYLLLWRITGDESLVRAARRSGDFLVQRAWDEHARTFPFEWSGNGDTPEPHSYFFDCGIIARGLVALWRETAERAYLDAAIGCAEAMLRDFVNEEDIHPILELPSKKALARDRRWSRTSDCYQMKSALAWLELAEITGRRDFEREYHRALQRALSTEARFLEIPERESVMDRLHAYSYYLEALLPMTDIVECRESLEAGISRAGRLLREIRPQFERSDVSAQILRLRLHADRQGAVRLNEAAATEEAEWVAGHQLASADPRVHGGFSFGHRGGERTPHVNPVSTAFCVDALMLWHEREDHEAEPPDWRDLI